MTDQSSKDSTGAPAAPPTGAPEAIPAEPSPPTGAKVLKVMRDRDVMPDGSAAFVRDGGTATITEKGTAVVDPADAHPVAWMPD